MARDIQDSISFLRGAKSALAELEAEKAKSSRLQMEEKRLTRALEAEKKRLKMRSFLRFISEKKKSH